MRGWQRAGRVAIAAPKRMTAEQLEALPGAPARRDLVRGALVEMLPAGRQHGKLALHIGSLLLRHVSERGLGEVYAAETGFVLARDPDTVLAPDVAFVRAERLVGQDEDRFLRLAPDLVVEVVSPSDRAGDVHDKVMEYLQAGVPLVWVCHPTRREVAVYGADRTARVLRVGEALTGGAVLPDFHLPLAALFG